MSDRVDIFLDKYKQLENVVKAEFHLSEKDSAMGFLMNRKAFQGMKNELDLCRETRNLLSHNPKVKGSYAVEPSEKMVQLLDEIINKVQNPLRARDIMVYKNDLYYCGMNDGVREAMKIMNSKSYAHIPIMDNDVVIGVFSENILLSLLVDEKLESIDDNLKFNKISKYLDLNRVGGESYRFIPQNESVSEISEMYKRASDKNDRIGMIFVTHNGKASEKVLGIITAWELAEV